MRRILAMSLATALMLAVVWLVVSQAEATVADTCKELGFSDNLEADSAGAWGSVDFDEDEPELILVVEAGWEVRVCIKAGSAQQGGGPEDLGWFDEGEYTLDHSTGKDLSHYGIDTRQLTTTTQGEATTTVGETTTTTIPDSTTSTTRQDPPPPTLVPPPIPPAASGKVTGACVGGEAQIDVEAGVGDYQLTIDVAGERVKVADFTGPIQGRFTADADEGDWVMARLYSSPRGDHTESLDAFGFRIICAKAATPTTAPGVPSTVARPVTEGTLPFTGPVEDLVVLSVIAAIATTLGWLLVRGIKDEEEEG